MNFEFLDDAFYIKSPKPDEKGTSLIPGEIVHEKLECECRIIRAHFRRAKGIPNSICGYYEHKEKNV